MKSKEEEIQISLQLYGWSGEVLDIGSPEGIRNLTVPKGCSVWEFLSEWLFRNADLGEFVFDSDRNDLKADVMVILNGSIIKPRGKTILHSGDSLALLRVADGG